MIIGLTGGIASGKSTAAKFFAEQGAFVIDADKLGHHAYLKGSQAFHAVVATFGEDIIGEDGEIDRRALGGKVFGDTDKLKSLTDIVWPAIRTLAEDKIQAIQAADPARVIVIEAAVLLEAGWQTLVDQIWATVVDPEIAVARASARDGLEPQAVQARIDAQLSNAERTAAASQIIDNSGTEDALERQLETLWSQISRL